MKYLIFFKKKVSIMSCLLVCGLLLLTLVYFLSLLPPNFALLETAGVLPTADTFHHLYKHSSDQKISPNVNNKYL